MSAFADVAPLIQALGPALQPFLASGGAVGVLFLIVVLVQARKPKQSKEELEGEQWDHKKMTELREENDQLRAQLRDTEQRLSCRLRDTETDRDRGWSLARGMSMVAHDLYHQLANASQLIVVEHRPPMPRPVPTLEEMQGVSPYAFPERYVRAPEPTRDGPRGPLPS